MDKAGDYETYIIKMVISFIQKAGEIGGFQMANEEGTWEEQELKRIGAYEQLLSDLGKIDWEEQELKRKRLYKIDDQKK